MSLTGAVSARRMWQNGDRTKKRSNAEWSGEARICRTGSQFCLVDLQQNILLFLPLYLCSRIPEKRGSWWLMRELVCSVVNSPIVWDVLSFFVLGRFSESFPTNCSGFRSDVCRWRRRRTPDWGVDAAWGNSLPANQRVTSPVSEGLKQVGMTPMWFSPLFWICSWLTCCVSVQGLHPLKDPAFVVFEGESFRDLVTRISCC